MSTMVCARFHCQRKSFEAVEETYPGLDVAVLGISVLLVLGEEAAPSSAKLALSRRKTTNLMW